MLKVKLIRGIINISSIIQTSLINYLEFHKVEPRETEDKGYDQWKAPPDKPEDVPKPFRKEDVIKPNYKILLKLAEEQNRIIKPLTKKRKVPLRTGAKCCRKCKAPQEYLFRAFNPETRGIIAEHFSIHRDTKGAITLNKKVIEQYLRSLRDPQYKLISDQAPIYPAAIDYLESKNKARIEHYAIKGIFDEPDEECSEYRPEKQMIERSFEGLKSGIKRRRRFGSLKGAKTFCFLHKIYYNHLRPHENLNNRPPTPLHLKSGKQVSNWNEIIQYISEKRR